MRTRSGRALVIAALLAAFAAGLVPVAGHAAAPSVPAPPVGAQVSTPDEYRTRVKAAVELAQLATGDALDEDDAAELAAGLEGFLPASERVEVGGTVVTVDNSVLASLLTRLESADSGAARRDLVLDIRAHLESLYAAQGVPGEPVRSDPDALEGLLRDRAGSGRSAFQEFFGDLVDRIGTALVEWWEARTASSGAGRVLTVVTWTLLALIVLALGWVALRAYLRARAQTAGRARGFAAGPAGPAPVSAAEGLPEDPLAFADELAAAGDGRGAVRALFGGAARLLAEAGLVRQARTLTNGELLAQAADRAPLVHGPLAALRSRFESAWYGHHEPGPQRVAEAREHYLAVRDKVAGASGEPGAGGGDAA